MTEAAILEALRAARQNQADEDRQAMTSTELAQAEGIGIVAARRLIRKLVAEGQAEGVRVRRRDMRGTTQTVPAYRLILRAKRA